MADMKLRGVGNHVTYVAIVDDDKSVCRSLSRLLRMAGFQPVSYTSAESLLRDTKHPRFDCLVLDIQLEGMSGLELSQRLTSVNDATPVIFITAHDDPEVRSQALGGGCAGYFRKTDSGQLVIDTIRQAIERVTRDDAGTAETSNCTPKKESQE